MTAPPFVTVVVPTHNRPAKLDALLRALEGQRPIRGGFEVVVVPSPADPGAAVAEAAAARGTLALTCRAVPDDPFGGRSASAKRNHGAGLARGEWLAFTDDDCVPDPNWLAGAEPLLRDAAVAALEGATRIPPPEPGGQDMVFRLMQNLEKPGGYQTCNMFYRRSVFHAVGGFDERFPYYLEDSDLAWTLLDAGHAIRPCPDAVVRHPVVACDPLGLLYECPRVAQTVLLRRKHPLQYSRSGVRALGPFHAAVVGLTAAAAGAGAAGSLPLAGGLLAALAAAEAAQLWRLFRGTPLKLSDLALTAALLPVVPWVRLWYLAVGLRRYRGRPQASVPAAAPW